MNKREKSLAAAAGCSGGLAGVVRAYPLRDTNLNYFSFFV